MNIPKLAIIRGPNLNKWDMQFYEPLRDRYDIIAYGSKTPNFDLSEVLFPIIQLRSNPNSPSHLIGLERELIYRGFDIICTADFIWIFSLQAIKVKEVVKNTKVVVYSSEIQPLFYEEDSVVSENKEIVRKNADMIIAATERAKEAFLIEGVPEEKIAVINRGVDLKRFCPRKGDILKDRKSLNIPDNEFVILFIGRYDEQKGISDLVFAAKKLSLDPGLKNIPFRFLMVGKGQSFEKIKRLIDKLGITKKFQFILEYSYTEIHKLHNLSDLLVLPSTIIVERSQERFGMVLIEAMATGTPVISTYSGAIPEVVKDAGILIPPSNFVSLANAIKKMVLNRELRDRLSRIGRKMVEDRFDSIKIADKIDKVFQSLLCDSKKMKIYAIKNNDLNNLENICRHRFKGSDVIFKKIIKKKLMEIKILQRQRRRNHIKKILEEVKKYQNNNMLTYLLLGKKYLELGEWEESEKWLKKIALFSKDWKNLYYIAICQLNQNKVGLAILNLNKSLDSKNITHSWKRKIYNQLGKAYEKIKAFKKAEAYYLSALKLKPDSKEDINSLGNLYLESNELEKGLKIFKDFLKKYPKSGEATLGLGEILWKIGQKEEGFKKIASSLNTNIENPEAISSLISKAFELKRYDIAGKYLKSYLEYHPLNLDILFELGRIYFLKGNYDECKAIMKKILIFQKDHRGARDIIKEITLAKAI